MSSSESRTNDVPSSPPAACRSVIGAILIHLALAVAPAIASEPVRLTRDGARKMAPTFIDGGAAIVYAAHVRPNLVALVQVSCRDGSRRERVLPTVVDHQFDPAFTADGRYLAYSRTATSPPENPPATWKSKPRYAPGIRSFCSACRSA